MAPAEKWREELRTLNAVRDKLNSSEVSLAYHEGEFTQKNPDTTPFKNIVKDICKEYGKNRVKTVLATVVRKSLPSDPRYSRQNREWAESVPAFYGDNGFPQEQIGYVNTHPCIVNTFINEYRALNEPSEKRKANV